MLTRAVGLGVLCALAAGACGGGGDRGGRDGAQADARASGDERPPGGPGSGDAPTGGGGDAPAAGRDAAVTPLDSGAVAPGDAGADVSAGPRCIDPAQLPPAPPDPRALYQVTASCASAVAACGGALDGTAWALSTLCYPTATEATRIRSVCASAVIGTASMPSASGRAVFRNGSLQLEVTASATASLTLPNNCAFCRCSDKESQLLRAGVTSARCSPACGGSGECTCTLQYRVLISENGSYTVNGSTFISATGRKFDYCVSDGMLSVAMADGTRAVFTPADPSPRPEICDGRDNDFDGQVDNNPVECAPAKTCLDVGVCAQNAQPFCQAGRWSCKYTSPAYEMVETRCDGLDNDCDGMTDELPECLEVCDGKDNDGNGIVDDKLTDKPPACESLGVCAGATMAVCGGAAGWSCQYGSTYESVESRCDGLDNDCDGKVDEVCPRCASIGKVAMLWDQTTMPASASACVANLDGTGTPLRIDNLPPKIRMPSVIDGAAGKLYFVTVDPIAIRRVGLDGSGLELFHSPVDYPWSLDLDDAGEWLYFSNVGQKEVHRLQLATKKEEVTARGMQAYDLRVEGSQMYYQDGTDGPLVRSNLDGTGAVTLVTGISSGWDVDLVNNRIVYHSNSGKLRIADLRGANGREIFDPPNVVWRIRTDPWADWIYYISNYSTHRIRPDGTSSQIIPVSCMGMRELNGFTVGVCVPR